MVTTLITVERNNLHTSIGLVSCHLIDFQLYTSSPLAIYLAMPQRTGLQLNPKESFVISSTNLVTRIKFSSILIPCPVQSCSFFVVLISSWLKELIKNPWNRRQMLNSSILIKNTQAWVSSPSFERASSSVRKARSLAFIPLWVPTFKFSSSFFLENWI
jgi:hypothetical protein